MSRITITAAIIVVAYACGASDANPLRATHVSGATQTARTSRVKAPDPSPHLVRLAQEASALRADVDRAIGAAEAEERGRIAASVSSAVHASAASAAKPL